MNKKAHAALYRPCLTVVCAFAAGILIACVNRQTDTDLMQNLLMLLLRPWTLLGQRLRAWSLSGAQGNAAAWAVMLVLSLLPLLCLLPAHRRSIRKRRRKSDLLFPLTGVCVFVCLYLLVNPSLCVHPVLAASTDASLQGMTPALTLLSLLTACILVRLSDDLSKSDQPGRLLCGMKLLLRGIMVLIAASAGYVLTQSIQSIPPITSQVYILSPAFYDSAQFFSASDAWAQLLLTIIDLTPDLFMVITLHHACTLCGAFGEYGFRQETEAASTDLALWAKHTLISTLLCMAARNAAAMLLGRFLTDLSITLTLPLTEMAFSCGTMLLARCLSAACRIQRENDLMI